MSTALKIVTNPSTEPVSRAEAIAYCRGNNGIEDALFDRLISVATEQVELITEHRLITHTSEQYFDCFPEYGSNGAGYGGATDGNRRFYLRYPPVSVVNSLKYYDEDGNLQTWAATNYWTVNNSKHECFIQLKPSASIPTLENGRPQSVIINYDNGYGTTSASVPETFRQAIMMFVNDLYYARRNNLEDVSLTENATAMQILGSLAINTPDVISMAQFTNVSGGYTY
jgi:uncharacterized phiE125 gp8 family phage protein